MTCQQAHVLPRNPLGARSGRDERDRDRRLRRGHNASASATSLARTGHGHAEPLPARTTLPAIASSSCRLPARTSRAAEVVRSGIHLHDPRPLGGGHHLDPVGGGNRTRLGERLLHARTPLGIRARARRWSVRVSAVALDTTAARAAFRQSTRFSSSSISTCMPAARRMLGSLLELVVGEIVRCHRHDPGRRALDDLHAPDAIGLELGEAGSRDRRPGRRARISSRCSSPFRSGSTTAVLDGVRLDALERLGEIGRLHGDDQERHGLDEPLDHHGPHVHRLRAVRLERDPGERHQPDDLRGADADRAVVRLGEP